LNDSTDSKLSINTDRKILIGMDPKWKNLVTLVWWHFSVT